MTNKEPIDITTIFNKLNSAGIVTKHSTGYSCVFSIEKHSHLLADEELNLWLNVLHQSSPHPNEQCTDLHSWNFELLN